MNKTLKIILNISVFILIAGFGTYMIRSIFTSEETKRIDTEPSGISEESPYKKTDQWDATSEIIRFDIHESGIYMALSDRISVFDTTGKHLRDFNIEPNARDIKVDDSGIYILFPNRIALYSFIGEKKDEWEACSENSDYCSFTITNDYFFVTDAENKLIWQYDKQGQLVRFIKSPDGFVIPSYSFDIINLNDTLYCSNSGRHKIESYTLKGEFISSFGIIGTQAGAFSGCCNPVYLEKTGTGNLITSEKGNPRISCYGRDGKFHTILFDSKILGSGTSAYEIHISGERIYIASKKTISVYEIDPNRTGKSCIGCEEYCPVRERIKNKNK